MDDLVSDGEEKPESEIAPGRAPSEEKMSTSELDSASRAAQAAGPMPSSSSISNLAAPVANRKLKGYVGFANLPNQVHKQSIRKGFDFTILVVGEDGLGKVTLLNSLFNEQIATPSDSVNSNGRIRVIQHDATIEESGIQLRLTALVTSNFAGALNNEGTWNDIVDAVENRFNEYLDQETITSKRSYIDRRIHACLYMIAPTGHCLKALDLEVLKRLHDKVNIIPVIAKGDSMTEDELKTFKQRVLADLNAHKIRTFVPELDDLDDEETKMEKTRIIARIPFAVSASTTLYENGNRKIRGRKYPWGVVETENEEHNDFSYLRQLLIRSHMEELREVTVSGMYERHRSRKMATTGYDQNHPENAPFLYFADEKKAHDLKMQKMEAEMRMVFEQKVHEKEAKLKAAEEELYAQHRAAITNLEKQRAELEERKRRIEEGRPGTPERKKRGLRW